MDQPASNQPNQPNQPNPEVIINPSTPESTRFNRILMLGISSAILVLIILILNYFNILPLSKIYPQLGFLPHQTSNQTFNEKKVADLTPVPSLESNIKSLLITSLSKILAPTFIPSTAEIILTQDKITKENFLASWDTSEGTASATFTTSSAGNAITSLYLHLLSATIQPTSLSTEVAQTRTSKFFSSKPKGVWSCKPLYNQTYCENFWQEEKGIKIGLGVQGPVTLENGRKTLIIFFCEYTKDTALYSWQSCTTEFSKTGVK